MRSVVSILVVLGLVVAAAPARARHTQPAQGAAAPAPREVDPGVFNTSPIIDRAELRAGRLEIRPGGARRVHQHDDVLFHLFIPLTGSVQLNVGSQIIEAVAGQVYFIPRGTPHGFKNTSGSVATAVEVFIKPTANAAAGATSPADQLTIALAAARAAIP